MGEEREMISLPTASQRMRLPWIATYNLVLKGTLRGEQRGGRWYVRVADVERVAREREQRAVPA